MKPRTLNHLPAERLRGVVVAVRADFNVPLAAGTVADGTRIERTLPTLGRLTSAGARVVILSHLGRPGGNPRPEFTLAPVAAWLKERLPAPLRFVRHSCGPRVLDAVRALGNGEAALLENTRFLAQEATNSRELAAGWSRWADCYVNDAFGTLHRAHASTDGLPRAVRAKGGEAVAGCLVESELRVVDQVLNRPARPFAAVLGGAKVSGKIDVIKALLPRVDRLLIGGAMANTFFLALGLKTGCSLVEPGKAGVARRLLADAGPRLVLPVDCVVGPALAPGSARRTTDRSRIAPEETVGDIGPATVQMFARHLQEAATVFWNGPMGAFEVPGFHEGTRELALAGAGAADRGATVVVGGGDSIAAAKSAGVAARLTHVSTGGGALLEFMSGKELPGLAALSRQSAGE